MFGLSLSVQYVIFLKSMAIGFVFGCCYSVTELIPEKAGVLRIVTDTVCFCAFTVILFAFCLDVNFGKGRLYIFAGAVLGFRLFNICPGSAVGAFFGKCIKYCTIIKNKRKSGKID